MDKIALITGASSGIGRALSLELASRDIHVIAISRRREELKTLQSNYPKNIDIIAADLTTKKDRENIVCSIAEYKKINFLIHNAAIITPLRPLQTISEQEIRQAFEINLIAPILLTNELLPYLHLARILDITSRSAHEASEGLSLYCMTKAGLAMWAKSQQLELKNHQIAVTTVIPGEVDTDMQKELREAFLRDFHLATEFQRAKNENALISPQTCALFLAWLLLDTTLEEFTCKEWNIYDTNHHKHWLKSKLPSPLNQFNFYSSP